MRKRHNISTLVVMVLALGTAWAQDNSAPGQTVPGNVPDSSQQQEQSVPANPPAPAYGQPKAVPIDENPPISGLDQPALGPHAAPLSYLQPGATFSEAADSNVADALGTGGGVRSVTRGLGTLVLRRLWSNFDLALDYAGGVGYYAQRGIGFKLLQQLAFDQKVKWKRGQLSVRDDFSYLPEGNFASVYGSLNSELGSPGTVGEGVFGGTNFGQLGEVPRLMNLSVADLSQNLSPKSALTLAGGYGLVHFYGSDPELNGISFVGSSETSAQGGYDRVLSPHDQVALIYGYQGFRFTPGGCELVSNVCVGPSRRPGTAFHSNVIQLAYAHRVSGRLDFTIGAGPQITQLSLCSAQFGLCEPDTTTTEVLLGVAGQALLRYRFPKTSLSLSYRRITTAGSGIFAGAKTDVARLQASRPISRTWSGFADLGYARNSRIEPIAANAVSANTFTYGFFGTGLHRMLGRHLHVFASYQFNELSLDESFCSSNPTACSRISQRHVGTVGLDWTPRPIRID
jgi:hypothetical protein